MDYYCPEHRKAVSVSLYSDAIITTTVVIGSLVTYWFLKQKI